MNAYEVQMTTNDTFILPYFENDTWREFEMQVIIFIENQYSDATYSMPS